MGVKNKEALAPTRLAEAMKLTLCTFLLEILYLEGFMEEVTGIINVVQHKFEVVQINPLAITIVTDVLFLVKCSTI